MSGIDCTTALVIPAGSGPPEPIHPAGRQTVTFQVDSGINTVGMTRAQINEAIQIAFDRYYHDNCGVKLVIVSSGAMYRIASGVLHVPQFAHGMHARGQLIGGRNIMIHTGHIPAHASHTGRAYWWDANHLYGRSPDVLAGIIAHEIGHTSSFFGTSHSGSTSCLMHINASAKDLCSREKQIVRSKYGSPAPPPPPPPPPEYPWQNPDDKYDVNDDGRVTSSDALKVINAIGRIDVDKTVKPRYFYDVNGDGKITASDANMVINAMRRG